MRDLNFKGPTFTWNNQRNRDANIQERLDRVLASVAWINKHHDFFFGHLEDRGSDHRPILLGSSSSFPKAQKRFFFDSRWINNSIVYDMVRQSWNGSKEGLAMFKAYSKLRDCRRTPSTRINPTCSFSSLIYVEGSK